MKSKIKARTKLIVLISSLVSICLVLLVAINADRNISRMSENNSELYSAFKISELMKSFRSNLLVLENKQKGYLITGDPKFLEEYRMRDTKAKTDLKSMEKYFSGRPEEELFYTLKDLTYKKLTEAKDLNQSKDLAGFQGQTDNEMETMQTMAEIQLTIDKINESLSRTTKILIDNSVEFVRASKNWSTMEIFFGILIAVIAATLLFRDINVRNRLEAELRVAKQKADDNALLKEQFMANMSHEIRTPMNAILGFTHLLGKTELDKQQSGYLSAVQTSGSNLLNIINDILDFSKIEAGKLTIEKIPFHIEGVIDSLRVMFEVKAAGKHISFHVFTDETIPKFVFGDPTRLTQILVNLINNAIKFTTKGSVTVHCELLEIKNDTATLVFRIKDTGIGIPDDKIDAVFERFNQGNKETTRKFGGTGLGLSIVKSLVEIQNGKIELTSKEGLGSEFSVILSYPISNEGKVDGKENNLQTVEKIGSGHLRVLLAEDNELNQKLATSYLSGFGLVVDIAQNGAIAFEKIKNSTYDLVLMDIQMPVLDGYHTAQKIRTELKSEIPIIAMTAHIMQGEREKCISFGMNDYITKPFKEIDLYNLVNKYIGDTSRLKKESDAKAHSAKSSSVLDLDDLYSLSRGNNGFIIEMIDLFIEKNPSDLKEIKEALKKKDFDSIRSVSHRMKTSVGFMGLKSLLPPLSEIELLSENNKDLEVIEKLFYKVKSDCETAIKELKTELKTLQQKI